MGKHEDKTTRIIEDLDIKHEIVELENFYITGQVNNLPQLVEERKNAIVNQITEYKINNTIEKLDEDGNVISTTLKTPPFVISNYFFRSITNLQNLEPQYSGEHLSVLWNLYSEIVMQVNLNLCEFTPTLSHFCKFIGLTTSGFKKMRNSSDNGIKTMALKIMDALYDENVQMAELGKHNPRATVYRMKSEMERIEKETPTVTINATTINMDDINKRIAELNSRDCFK